MLTTPPWKATGLIFENCNCQLLCPAHVSFKQKCTHERCKGYWAFHIFEGYFDNIDLSDLNGVVVFDTPQRMYEGDWTQACYIDERASGPQRTALTDILSGRVGGPWEILDAFVNTRLDPKFVPIHFENGEREKRLTISDMFDTTVTAIEGADGSTEAKIENLHNVLHGTTHILARGQTRCRDRVFNFAHSRTHGLYSRFSWKNDR